MKFAIALIAAIVIVVINLVLIYLAWRGYKTKQEFFPLILALCALPVVVVLAGMIVYGNM